MSGFTVRPARFQKVQGSAKTLEGLTTGQVVEAIVKVSEPHYVPSGVKVRSHIDPQMLTGEMPAQLLDDLEQDPKVEAVSISRPLRLIE